MVYCAAYGCNNKDQKGSGISFFYFPKDPSVRKAWIHFCRRWNFVPGNNHRLCSDHFSMDCFDKHPQKYKDLGMNITCRPSLKPNVVPNIPIQLPDKDGDTTKAKQLQIPQSRGAYEKRRRTEIIQMAFEDHARSQLPDKENEDPIEVEPPAPSPAAKPDVVENQDPPKPTMVHRKIQVCRRPKMKTRCYQTTMKETTTTQTPPATMTISTQTDISLPVVTESVLDSDDDDDPATDDMSDSDYNPLDESTSSDEESSDETETVEMNYKLTTDAPVTEEKQFLVSETALAELLSVCRYCSAECTPFIQSTRGTMISTHSICINGHVSLWKSQTCKNSLPLSNLMVATAILCSGCNAAKAMRLFQHLNLQMFSYRTYVRLQSLYVAPSAIETWDYEQNTLLTDIQGKEVVVGGDARCDSPGYSAKYGSYTIMDLETSKILDVQLVQCNEVKGSTHMELEGLKRALVFLKNHVQVKELVTDRHTMVKKFMREQHPDKVHYFDVWHVAKGVSKKLEKLSKKKIASELQPWVKSVKNHIYWISASCGTNQDLKRAKWLAISNHVANQHEDHSEMYPRCEHDELPRERHWLKEGSVPHKLLKQVVENQFLLKDVPKLSPVHQTYGLEVFHSVVNHFAPKSTHFFYAGMQARISIAALHYNENCERHQAKTNNGQHRFRMTYPKANKGTIAVVKPIRTEQTFDYVTLIKQAVLERREQNPSYTKAKEDLGVINDHHPLHLTATFPQFCKRRLIEEHRSRFQTH